MRFAKPKNTKELVRRYVVFFTALVLGALGVTLATRAMLGINSLACMSYVFSVYFPITMGTVTILFNIFMIFCQLVIYTAQERKEQMVNIILQVPAFLFFGVLVDIFMYLTDGYVPLSFGKYGYVAAVATFIVGSFLIAANVTLQAIAAVAKLSCDAFIIIIAERMHKSLGLLKFIFDASLVVVAALVSLFCSDFTQIIGIREGTIIGVFLVGFIIQFLMRHTTALSRWIVA